MTIELQDTMKVSILLVSLDSVQEYAGTIADTKTLDARNATWSYITMRLIEGQRSSMKCTSRRKNQKEVRFTGFSKRRSRMVEVISSVTNVAGKGTSLRTTTAMEAYHVARKSRRRKPAPVIRRATADEEPRADQQAKPYAWHAGQNVVQEMINNSGYCMEVEEKPSGNVCETCVITKQTKSSMRGRLITHDGNITVNSDICGPFETRTKGGRR